MSEQTVRFNQPMNRLRGAPPTAPYEFRNARLEPAETVRAHRKPSVPSEHSAFPDVQGDAPFIYWNGQILNGKDEEIEDYVQTDSDIISCSRRQYPARIKRYRADYEPGDDVVTPPLIQSVEWNTAETEHSQDSADLTQNLDYRGIWRSSIVQYIFIPVNDVGEAGPWVSFSVNPRIFGDKELESQNPFFCSPKFEFDTNEKTDRVEVYRTRELVRSSAYSMRRDYEFYYVGESGEDTYFDEEHFPTQDRLDQYESDGSHYIRWDSPSITLDREINLYDAEYTPSFYTDIGITSKTLDQWDLPGANAVHQDAGRMLYGGVEWPTKKPQLMYASGEIGISSGGLYDIMVISEYRMPDREIYSDTVTLNSTTEANIEYRGETAILVFVKDANNGWRKWERITPQGQYYRSEKNHARVQVALSQRDERQFTAFTFDSLDVDEWLDEGNSLTDLDLYNEQDYPYQRRIYEPNVVMYSRQNAPREITPARQFKIADDAYVNAILPARVSEEESVRSYRFYVFTRSAVYVADRQETNTTLDTVTSVVGMEEGRIEINGETQFRPIYTVTKYSVVFLGTDQRVYQLSARQFEPIDNEVPGLWYEAQARQSLSAVASFDDGVFDDETFGGGGDGGDGGDPIPIDDQPFDWWQNAESQEFESDQIEFGLTVQHNGQDDGEYKYLLSADVTFNNYEIVEAIWDADPGNNRVFLSDPLQAWDYDFIIPGDYKITVTLTDSADNSKTIIRYIRILENQASMFEVSEDPLFGEDPGGTDEGRPDGPGRDVVKDMTYSTDMDEVYLVGENDVWIYSFALGGWIGHHRIKGARQIQYLRRFETVMVRLDPAVDHGYKKDYIFLTERGEQYEDAGIITQPLFDTAANIYVKEMRLDYTPQIRESICFVSNNNNTLSLPAGSSGSRFKASDVSSPILVQEVIGEEEKDLRSVIQTVNNANSITLYNSTETSKTTIARWFPRVRVKHETHSDIYYFGSERLGNINPARRQKTYRVYAKRRSFPRMSGSGHIMVISGFSDLREMLLTIERLPFNG